MPLTIGSKMCSFSHEPIDFNASPMPLNSPPIQSKPMPSSASPILEKIPPRAPSKSSTAPENRLTRADSSLPMSVTQSILVMNVTSPEVIEEPRAYQSTLSARPDIASSRPPTALLRSFPRFAQLILVIMFCKN